MRVERFDPAAALGPEPRRHAEMVDVHQLAHRIMLYLLAFTAMSVVGFPLFWMLISSFKTAGELYVSPPTFLPQTWTLDNYVLLFTQTNFPIYFMNSLIVAAGATVLSLIIGGLGAYSLSRFNFFGIQGFARVALICYMLPEVLLVLPLYIYVIELGLADTLTRIMH